MWHYKRHVIELHSQMVFDCAVILHIFDTEQVLFRFYCVVKVNGRAEGSFIITSTTYLFTDL